MSEQDEYVSPAMRLFGLVPERHYPDDYKRSELISIIEGLTQMTAQQSRIIGELRRQLKQNET